MMTRARMQLFAVIREQKTYKSLFRAADSADMDYKTAWRCLCWLEEMGYVRVERSCPGSPMVIHLKEQCEVDHEE